MYIKSKLEKFRENQKVKRINKEEMKNLKLTARWLNEHTDKPIAFTSLMRRLVDFGLLINQGMFFNTIGWIFGTPVFSSMMRISNVEYMEHLVFPYVTCTIEFPQVKYISNAEAELKIDKSGSVIIRIGSNEYVVSTNANVLQFTPYQSSNNTESLLPEVYISHNFATVELGNGYAFWATYTADKKGIKLAVKWKDTTIGTLQFIDRDVVIGSGLLKYMHKVTRTIDRNIHIFSFFISEPSLYNAKKPNFAVFSIYVDYTNEQFYLAR